MLHVITSNSVPVKSIYQQIDNFELCHLFQKESLYPFSQLKMKMDFHVFHQDEMDVDQDDYKNNAEMEFHFNSSEAIPAALDSIVQTIETYYEKYNSADDAERNPEEFQILACCSYEWNQQAVKYLNNQFKEKGLDLEAVNVYKYFKAPSAEKLKAIIKETLNSDFIYPEDPISFAYSLYVMIMGNEVLF